MNGLRSTTTTKTVIGATRDTAFARIRIFECRNNWSEPRRFSEGESQSKMIIARVWRVNRCINTVLFLMDAHSSDILSLPARLPLCWSFPVSHIEKREQQLLQNVLRQLFLAQAASPQPHSEAA